MHRIDNATSSVALPPTEAPGPVPNGFFKAKTKLTHAWLNAIQEEVCKVIEEAGLTLDKADRTQFYDAVQILIAAGPGSPAINSVQEDTDPHLGGDLVVAGFAITSAANGDVVLTPVDDIDLNGNVLINTNIVHDGDANNLIAFGSNTQDYQVNGASVFDISNSGLRLGGANSRVTTILNETDLISNSDTALLTQHSYKTYVDDKVASLSGGEIIFSPILLAHASSSPSTNGARDWIGWDEIGVFDDFKFTFGNLHRALVIPFSGTLKNFYINLEETVLFSVTLTMTLNITIYKNFSATGVTFSFTGSVTADNPATRITFSDLINTISVSAGDEISLRMQFTGITNPHQSRLQGSISFLLE